MNGQPWSTITAASLAMMALTLLWEIAAQAGFEARGSLVAASVTFAGAVVGYFWPERVLEARFRAQWEAEQSQAVLQGSQDDTA